MRKIPTQGVHHITLLDADRQLARVAPPLDREDVEHIDSPAN